LIGLAIQVQQSDLDAAHEHASLSKDKWFLEAKLNSRNKDREHMWTTIFQRFAPVGGWKTKGLTAKALQTGFISHAASISSACTHADRLDETGLSMIENT
jgi:hypothetical protein